MCYQSESYRPCLRTVRAPDKRGVKGISALIFWNPAFKIKLNGENTLCSLKFQCCNSIYVVKSLTLSKKN